MLGYKTNLEIEWNGEKLDVTGTFYKGQPGQIYKRSGDPGDPPEPADFEIEKIVWSDKDIDITDFLCASDEICEKIKTIVIETLKDREGEKDAELNRQSPEEI